MGGLLLAGDKARKVWFAVTVQRRRQRTSHKHLNAMDARGGSFKYVIEAIAFFFSFFKTVPRPHGWHVCFFGTPVHAIDCTIFWIAGLTAHLAFWSIIGPRIRKHMTFQGKAPHSLSAPNCGIYTLLPPSSARPTTAQILQKSHIKTAAQPLDAPGTVGLVVRRSGGLA